MRKELKGCPLCGGSCSPSHHPTEAVTETLRELRRIGDDISPPTPADLKARKEELKSRWFVRCGNCLYNYGPGTKREVVAAHNKRPNK